MIKLIKNELIKIFKRKNIYILLIIGILIMLVLNIFEGIERQPVDMQKQYKRLYENDKMLLENYEKFNVEDSYEDIVERIKLEEYAMQNNIKYNIIINSENKNVILPKDARYLLIKVFKNFDILMIFLVIYLSSTIISEEYNNGTIKNLLIKPHKRTKILLSKIITAIFLTIIISILMVVFQYLLGGIIFGFDSYELESIKYNSLTNNIETMDLMQNTITTLLKKEPMYLLLSLVSMLFGIITNNIALNILISLGLYFISTMEFLINNITKYLFIFNWDLTTNNIINIAQSISICVISFLVIFILLIIIFKKKDISNE